MFIKTSSFSFLNYDQTSFNFIDSLNGVVGVIPFTAVWANGSVDLNDAKAQVLAELPTATVTIDNAKQAIEVVVADGYPITTWYKTKYSNERTVLSTFDKVDTDPNASGGGSANDFEFPNT